MHSLSETGGGRGGGGQPNIFLERECSKLEAGSGESTGLTLRLNFFCF